MDMEKTLETKKLGKKEIKKTRQYWIGMRKESQKKTVSQTPKREETTSPTRNVVARGEKKTLQEGYHNSTV